jgi:hypothetical protein
MHCRPDDGGSMHLWNVGLLKRDYTELYLKGHHLQCRHGLHKEVPSHVLWLTANCVARVLWDCVPFSAIPTHTELHSNPSVCLMMGGNVATMHSNGIPVLPELRLRKLGLCCLELVRVCVCVKGMGCWGDRGGLRAPVCETSAAWFCLCSRVDVMTWGRCCRTHALRPELNLFPNLVNEKWNSWGKCILKGSSGTISCVYFTEVKENGRYLIIYCN